jgi:hypothetical protein
MTKPNGQIFRKTIRRSGALNVLGPILLILLGIVFQLSELGYGHLRPENFWLFPMIATSVWNVFALHINVPGAYELLSFWPLLLICVGMATLLVKSSHCSVRPPSAPGTGATCGE